MVYEEGTLEQLEERRDVLNRDCQALKRELERKGGHRFEVQYRDPEPNFDRRQVKGMLCKLFDVRDQDYLNALSVCGGGSLYNLVVDNEIVSKKILEKGQLQTRTTIIPISKIRGSLIPADRVAMAQKLVGAENCIPAIDLIEYDPQLQAVMEYVFGRTFICRDMNVAKQVTYHRQILTRSITMDGDSLDPEGTLSGGSAPTNAPVLVQIAEIKQVSRELDAKTEELRKVLDEIAAIAPVAQKFNQMKGQLEGYEYELESITKLLAQTTYQKHQQEIEDLKVEIGECGGGVYERRETEN